MSIFRIKKKKRNFSIIDNNVINDEVLSYQAKGLLIYLLSKPSNWTVKKFDLVKKANGSSEYFVTKVIKELCDAGYMRLVRGEYEDSKGKMKFGSFYDVSEAKIEV